MSRTATATRLPALCDELGITYRQGWYWLKTHLLGEHAYNARPGSGYNRSLDAHEEALLREMARLVHAGMRPEAAARRARFAVDTRARVGPSGRELALAWAAGRGECA